jgi:hypothetical protein
MICADLFFSVMTEKALRLRMGELRLLPGNVPAE